jgi:hypothetical protein
MLATGLVSKTEGWPEQLTRGLIVSLERNGFPPRECAARGVRRLPHPLSRGLSLDTVEFRGPEGISR